MNACPKLTFESDLKGLPTVMKSGESLNPRRPIFMPRINTMIEDGRLPAVLNMKKLFEFFAQDVPGIVDILNSESQFDRAFIGYNKLVTDENGYRSQFDEYLASFPDKPCLKDLGVTSEGIATNCSAVQLWIYATKWFEKIKKETGSGGVHGWLQHSFRAMHYLQAYLAEDEETLATFLPLVVGGETVPARNRGITSLVSEKGMTREEAMRHIKSGIQKSWTKWHKKVVIGEKKKSTGAKKKSTGAKKKNNTLSATLDNFASRSPGPTESQIGRAHV